MGSFLEKVVSYRPNFRHNFRLTLGGVIYSRSRTPTPKIDYKNTLVFSMESRKVRESV